MKIMKRLVRDEKGQALIAAVILLLVGGLIVASLLSYMGTGLLAGRVYERRTAELYAADAGVEDAVWKIQNQTAEVKGLTQCYQSTNYTITDVNGKSVAVNITTMKFVNNVTFDYLVESIATGDGSGTKIEAYITGTTVYGNYSGITNNVITSQGEFNLKPGDNITPSAGENGPVANYTAAWPTAEELCAWYFDDVEGEESYDSDIMILNGDTELEPFYRNGELEIKSGTAGITVTLTGTVYITGDTLIGTTGKDFTLDLNGYTIFVASNSSAPKKALWVGTKCKIIGPGAIIAIGDVYFEPNIPVGMTDPVFIMSVVGKSTIQPGGNFYGSIAGSVEVNLQPNTSLNYPGTGFGAINFPGCTAGRYIYGIASWEVSPQ
jgi:Tfp pilus assembly protein PilX